MLTQEIFNFWWRDKNTVLGPTWPEKLLTEKIMWVEPFNHKSVHISTLTNIYRVRHTTAVELRLRVCAAAALLLQRPRIATHTRRKMATSAPAAWSADGLSQTDLMHKVYNFQLHFFNCCPWLFLLHTEWVGIHFSEAHAHANNYF